MTLGIFFQRYWLSGAPTSRACLGVALLALSSVEPASAAPLVYVFGRAEFSASNNGTLAAGGDFNGDGRPDLVAIDYQGGTVSLLLGQPDGDLAEIAPSYPVGEGPVAAAVGDFNQDGKLDLAVVSQNCPASDPCPPGVVSILLGNGDGTLQPRLDFQAGPNPVGIAVADFNGDGKPDLAVAAAVSRIRSDSPGLVSLLLGNGDGTFGAAADFPAGVGVVGLVAGDFSVPGVVDLVVDNHPSVSSTTVSFLRGAGDGTFGQPEGLRVDGDPLALAAGDFNEDGKLDLAVATGTHRISVLLGNGGGTFQAPVGYETGFGPQRVITADLDGDGHLDLVVSIATNINSNGAISVLLGDGAGAFRARSEYLVGVFGALVAGDFNGDAKLDVAVGRISVVLGNGNGTLAHAAQMATRIQPGAIVTGDFNGDGRPDLAVVGACACPGPGVSIFLGNPDGTFAPGLDFPTGVEPTALAVGDFDGDGTLDLAVANAGENNVSVLLGAGDGSFLPRTNFATGQVPLGVVAADFNGDTYVDLAVANSRDATVSILLGLGDGTFQPAVTYAAGRGAAGIVAADFNGDGRMDLAVANSQTGSLREQGTVSVLLGNGDGTFQMHRDSNTRNLSPLDLAVGDFNRDGNLDLAVTTNRDPFGSISILLGNGDGTLQMSDRDNYPTGRFARQLVAGDFDGDGITDLAQVELGSNLMILLQGREDGTFRTKGRYGAGVGPIGLAAGDFNGDGALDAAVINLGSNDASIFLSDPGVVLGSRR